MSDKACPRCGHHVTFGEFVRATSLRFRCRQCGAELNASLRRTLLATLIAAVPLGLAGSMALGEPIWWLGVVAALGFFFVVHYGFLQVELFRGGEAPRSRA